MKNKQLKLYIALALNILLIVLEIIGLVIVSKECGAGLFIYYTEDSNIFLLISCIITTYFIIKKLISKKDVPAFVSLIKYMSVCTVIETFLVVVTILGFTAQGDGVHSGYYIMLFDGSMLYHHTLCPVISLISFLLIENDISDKEYKFKDTLYAMIFTFIYGTIAIILNFAKVWYGPYPFLHVYEQSLLMSGVWFITVFGLAYGITVGVYYLNKIINKKRD